MKYILLPELFLFQRLLERTQAEILFRVSFLIWEEPFYGVTETFKRGIDKKIRSET